MLNKIKQLEIKINYDKANITLPFISIKNPKKGPRIFITACMHGDEKGSYFIAEKLIKILKNKLIRGELHVLPLLNPLGFKENSRFFNKKDLNAIFPGDKNGDLVNKIAGQIFSKIIQTKPDLVLDLHNDWEKSIYYALIDPKPKNTSNKICNKTIELGKRLLIPFVIDTDNLTGSLTYNLLKKNIPAITLELGKSSLKKNEIRQGVRIILNLLSHLRMIKHKKEQHIKKTEGKVLKYSQKPLPRRKGIARFSIVPGQIVKKGQILAKIYDPLGNLLEILKSPHNAIILGYSDSSLALPGQQLIALGIIK